MHINVVYADKLAVGMTVVLDPRTTATVLDVYPVADGRLIWVVLSNGATGTVTPRGRFDVLAG